MSACSRALLKTDFKHGLAFSILLEKGEIMKLKAGVLLAQFEQRRTPAFPCGKLSLIVNKIDTRVVDIKEMNFGSRWPGV